MREVQEQASPTGTVESMELDLTFLWSAHGPTSGIGSWGKHGRKSMHRMTIPPPMGTTDGGGATLEDCRQLLNSTAGWLNAVVAEGAENRGLLSNPQVMGDFGIRVKQLHYGSPFQLELLLPLLSPAGLAGILFAAKRLYGLDLEFKAYRESRRIEYLEAKARAGQLTSQAQAHLREGEASQRWRLIKGTLRDPSD
jgi:hypothetical protein